MLYWNLILALPIELSIRLTWNSNTKHWQGKLRQTRNFDLVKERRLVLVRQGSLDWQKSCLIKYLVHLRQCKPDEEKQNSGKGNIFYFCILQSHNQQVVSKYSFIFNHQLNQQIFLDIGHHISCLYGRH